MAAYSDTTSGKRGLAIFGRYGLWDEPPRAAAGTRSPAPPPFHRPAQWSETEGSVEGSSRGIRTLFTLAARERGYSPANPVRRRLEIGLRNKGTAEHDSW